MKKTYRASARMVNSPWSFLDLKILMALSQYVVSVPAGTLVLHRRECMPHRRRGTEERLTRIQEITDSRVVEGDELLIEEPAGNTRWGRWRGSAGRHGNADRVGRPLNRQTE